MIRWLTVFGFSFSELIVVVIVALVVMGPKDLPKMLRRLGQWAGKIRRAAADLRAQSGIDDALRSEGLADDIAEIRKLARGELDAVRQVATVNLNDGSSGSSSSTSSSSSTPQEHYGRGDDFNVTREREYPRDGADTYGALPDNAILYSDSLPKSPLNRDALYRLGDADAELPIDPVVVAPVTPVVGPTLMGIGVDDLAKAEAEASAAAQAAQVGAPGENIVTTLDEKDEKKEDATAPEPGAAGPTLIGVPGPEARS